VPLTWQIQPSPGYAEPPPCQLAPNHRGCVRCARPSSAPRKHRCSRPGCRMACPRRPPGRCYYQHVGRS
jgi:hypothetical protein